jgi:ribosomal protein S18 acetylase RimI-like enzyme
MRMTEEPLANYSIRDMREAELDFAAGYIENEGWLSEDRTTLESSFRYDPHGCFIAEQEDHPVGMCIGTSYGKAGFLGELIVSCEQRGKSLGTMLLRHTIAYLQNRYAETVYLDGVLKAVPLYEREGFHKVCRSWRFSGKLEGKASKRVRPMNAGDLGQVCALDRASFEADRSFFIKRRMQTFPELCYVMADNAKICGYITGRGYPERLYAGPWIVAKNCENPEDLLFSFTQEAKGRPISIGILDANQRACELVRSLRFEAREDSPWRMALGRTDNLGTSTACLAIGSAAKG